MSTTGTSTATHTTSVTRAAYVGRKVQADFIQICDFYRPFSEEFLRKVISDLITLLDEEVLAQIEFTWTTPGSSDVLDAIRYDVYQSTAVDTDSRAGGIKYRPELSTATFHVSIRNNTRWQGMTAQSQQVIQQRLLLRWDPAAALNYSGCSTVTDRSYVKDGLGLSRTRVYR